MATAPLPIDLALRPFFVLRWDRDMESMILAVPSMPDSSFDLGDDLPAVARQLQLRGLPGHQVDRAIGCAREWGIVQVIPDSDRMVNIGDRTARTPSLGDLLRAAERDEGQGIVHL
tara:strand:+ start:1604 stop:1951 length:348 start_codon:yes stop_codon:yes gene_type:complete